MDCKAQALLVDGKTGLGRALSRALSAAGFAVAECDAERAAVPAECSQVLYCHDAAQEPERHVAQLDALCGALAATHAGRHVRVCVFTPATVCEDTTKLLRERAALRPRTLVGLAHCQAELLLHSWFARSRGAIRPVIFRHGELYGLETGYIAECLLRARARQPLTLPGLGAQKRTLTHVEDLADAAAALLRKDVLPSPINLPGESLAVIDYLSPIADRFGVELAMGRDCHSEAFPWGLGDCVLATAAFKTELPGFRPKHRFRKWLQESR